MADTTTVETGREGGVEETKVDAAADAAASAGGEESIVDEGGERGRSVASSSDGSADDSGDPRPICYHEDTPGLAWERRVIMQSLQRIRHPFIKNAAWALGQFCSGEVLVSYFSTLYLVLDRYRCLYGIWLVPLSEVTNGMLKWHFRVARPGWTDKAINMPAYSHEYSMPSSHAQIIWALATFFSLTSRKAMRVRMYGKWAASALGDGYFKLGPFVFATCVSLSRVYEGVHYPRDVLAGAGCGVGLALAYLAVYRKVVALMKSIRSPWVRMLLLQLLPLVLYLALRRSYSKVRKERDPPEWRAMATRLPKHKGKELRTHDIPYSSYLGMLGVLSGLAVGAAFVSTVPMAFAKSKRVAFLRFLIGNVSLGAVFLGIRAAEKSSAVQSAGSPGLIAALRFARYGAVPIHILLALPRVFNLLGLRRGNR